MLVRNFLWASFFFVCPLLADHSVVCLCGKTKKELPKRVTPYFCGTTRNRTGDTRIFSPLLYQLSYGTIALICVCKDSTFVLTLQAFCEKCFVIVNFAFSFAFSLPFPAFLSLELFLKFGLVYLICFSFVYGDYSNLSVFYTEFHFLFVVSHAIYSLLVVMILWTRIK